jgi:hypothetical protein
MDYDSDWQFSKTKLKICGDIVTLYEYEREFAHGARPMLFKEPKLAVDTLELTSEELAENTKKNQRRAKNRVIDLINSNIYLWFKDNGKPEIPTFLTLTFRKNVTNIKYAKTEFFDFIRRLNYYVYEEKTSKLKYIAVTEFQKRGAVHYHVIFFNMPYRPRQILRRVWGNGHIDIQAVESAKDAGAYVTKYMVKDFEDLRLKGEKAYFCSKGLLKPKIVYHQPLIDLLIRQLPYASVVEEKVDIPVKYLLSMNQTKFNLKEFPELKKQLHDEYGKYF